MLQHLKHLKKDKEIKNLSEEIDRLKKKNQIENDNNNKIIDKLTNEKKQLSDISESTESLRSTTALTQKAFADIGALGNALSA